jgi:hypothetical protein
MTMAGQSSDSKHDLINSTKTRFGLKKNLGDVILTLIFKYLKGGGHEEG